MGPRRVRLKTEISGLTTSSSNTSGFLLLLHLHVSSKAPWLHRRYPASALLRASPSPSGPLTVMYSRYALALRLPGGSPRLLDGSVHARCPQPPRKARWVLTCCFPTGVRLHPSRRTGHLRIPIEAEPSSLALRLACLPIPMLRQMGFSIPRLLGYMSEQAIYMVNSFQFTRSARLILAYRPLGSVPAARQSDRAPPWRAHVVWRLSMRSSTIGVQTWVRFF